MKSKLLNDVLKYRSNCDVFSKEEKKILRMGLLSETKETIEKEVVYLFLW